MSEVLISGKHSFKIEVPYKLIETGPKGEKPLIVYLHGYKQNLNHFRKKMDDLFSLRAYHLILQAPYPVYDENHNREVKNWGRAWYLYDGNQSQFIKSMEISSEFIQEIIDTILPQLKVSHIALLGYSMGGYLAGYFALSRPNYINDLIIVGGRIKTEYFAKRKYPDLRVLALHGQYDKSVEADRAKESCQKLAKQKAIVTFRILDEGHRLNKRYIDAAKKWFLYNGYTLKK